MRAAGGRNLGRTWTALIACAALLLGGCGDNTPEPNDNAAEGIAPVVKTAALGPVRVTVTADKNRVSIAERLRLTIEVFAESGVDIELDEPGEKLNEFQIRGFTNNLAEEVEGGRRWVRTYDLDVFLSGNYSIPPIKARFIDHRKEDPDHPGEGVREGTIEAEPITIEVTSLLEGEFDPTRFRDIKGPVELPVEVTSTRGWWVIGSAAVLLIGLIVFMLTRRRKPADRTPPVIPHEWAFDQLRILVDEQLVEQGLVAEFYFRLTHIVRAYIELRFGLMAPEQTTQEFLVEAHRSPALRPDQKSLLGEFLQSADMVKFAKYQPAPPEIELAFDSARDFIAQSAAAEPHRTAEVAA